MKITFSAKAVAFEFGTDLVINDAEKLADLNDLAYSQDSCGYYLSESLYEIGVVDGEIKLVFNQVESLLRVTTVYRTPRKLKKSEMEQLIAETLAQWSDGIGEGEFQFAEAMGIDIMLPDADCDVSVAQEDDGVVVKRPTKNELMTILSQRDMDTAAVLDLIKRGANLACTDRYGNTPLHLACGGGHLKLVLAMLDRGADIHAVSELGSAPITALAMLQGDHDQQQRSVAAVEKLLAAGADIETPDSRGMTSLMWAVNRSNLPLAEYLISQGADVNRQDGDEANRCTVLMYSSDLRMTCFLLDNGADPMICTAYGANAHEYALQNSHQPGFRENAELIQSYMTT